MKNDLSEDKNGLRLNKFLAQNGFGTRRAAEQLVKQKKVAVNGRIETNPGFRVHKSDKITVDGKPVHERQPNVYVLLNKPKDTTLGPTDPKGRKTVRAMLGAHVPRSATPVRETDRHTLGLWLLTNDKELLERLNDPKRKLKQLFQLEFAEALSDGTLEKLGKTRSPKLEITFARQRDTTVDVELSRGDLVDLRRVLKSMELRPVKIDRVYFAGLTKRDLPRGRFRFLDDREVRMLRHFS